jgi:hypothetical protein
MTDSQLPAGRATPSTVADDEGFNHGNCLSIVSLALRRTSGSYDNRLQEQDLQRKADLTHLPPSPPSRGLMSLYNRFEIAARIRGLLASDNSPAGGILATRLGVTEHALRTSIDQIDPSPSFDVLVAVVRKFGADPTWLVTGQYDLARHRQSLADDALTARILAEAVAAPSKPAAPPAADRSLESADRTSNRQ